MRHLTYKYSELMRSERTVMRLATMSMDGCTFRVKIIEQAVYWQDKSRMKVF